MNRTLLNFVSVQFKEFFREPEILFWAIGFPIVLTFLLGIAIDKSGPAERKIAVVAETPARADSARLWLEEQLGEDSYIDVVSMDRDAALQAMKKGMVPLYIEQGADGGIRYFFDPRNREAHLAYLMIEHLIDQSRGGRAGEIVSLEVPGTRYIDFLVPGLLAMGIMGSAMWGIGWSLIEMRMKKLLRRMAATPMRKSTFLGSFFVTRLIINAIEFGAIFLFAYLYFGVRVQGSVPALVMVLLSGNMAFAGIAILTASRTANSRVGNGLINAVTFPMTLLSGVFFSYHNFPGWAVPIVRRLPLTLLADSIRSIFTEGAGFAGILGPSIALALLGIIFFSIGIRMFRWY